MTTLAELLAPTTSARVIAAAMARLQALGWPTTDWNALSAERIFIELTGLGIEDLSAATPALARINRLYSATGDGLTAHAHDQYQVDRYEATNTVGYYTLSNASANAYTITAGQFWVASPVTGNRYYVSDAGAGVLGAGGTLDVTITAEEPGSAYNDATNTLTQILTPLSGVTGTNPAPTFTPAVHAGLGAGTITPSGIVAAASWSVRISLSGVLGAGEFQYAKNSGAYGVSTVIPALGVYGPDADGLVLTFAAATYTAGDTWTFAAPGSWMTTVGADEEGDEALRIRCIARWPSLNSVSLVAPTLTAYDGLARQASSSITRTKLVTSTTISNRMTIYLATAAGPAPASLVNTVQAYIDRRKPITDRPVAAAATSQAVTLAGTIYVRGGQAAAAQSLLDRFIAAYLLAGPSEDDEVAIGFDVVPIGGTVYYSQMIEILMAPSGVVRTSGVTVNGAAADLALPATAAATWSQTSATAFTWVET